MSLRSPPQDFSHPPLWLAFRVPAVHPLPPSPPKFEQPFGSSGGKRASLHLLPPFFPPVASLPPPSTTDQSTPNHLVRERVSTNF